MFLLLKVKCSVSFGRIENSLWSCLMFPIIKKKSLTQTRRWIDFCLENWIFYFKFIQTNTSYRDKRQLKAFVRNTIKYMYIIPKLLNLQWLQIWKEIYIKDNIKLLWKILQHTKNIFFELKEIWTAFWKETYESTCEKQIYALELKEIMNFFLN